MVGQIVGTVQGVRPEWCRCVWISSPVAV